MTRTNVAGWSLVIILVVVALVWGVMGDWESPDFSGAEYEFVAPSCDEVPQLCGTPVAVR